MKKLSKILALVLVLMMVLATVSVFNFTASAAEDVTVTTVISEYADNNSWADATKYTSVTMDSNITVTVSGSTNTGKYYVNGENWRVYQGETPSIVVKAADGVTIKTVKITYAVSNTGVLTLNGSNISSGTAVDVNASSVTFGVGNTGTKTNGQVRITTIEVVYSVAGDTTCQHANTTPVEEAPTCTEAGKNIVTCTDCGAVVETSEGDPATGHTNENGVCTDCGLIFTIPGALEAADGAKVQITATVKSVDGAWNSQYGNMNVTLVDADENTIYVYRLATEVALGDIITVTGVMGTYNGRQIAQGATATIDGHDDSYDYTEMTVEEALAAEDNTNIIVTGTVVKINTAYSSSYDNISVTISDDNGTQLYIYRLAGGSDLAVGDIITVKGSMATYSGSRQVAGGTYEEIGTHTCAKWTDATCTAAAKCVVCGTANGEALEHSYTEFVETVAPTFDGVGYDVYKCVNGCNNTTNLNEVPALVAVAQIGETKYASLQEALNAGGEVVLLTDIGLTTNIGVTIPKGVVVVLDLNGHVLGSNATEAATSAVISNKGTLTIKDTVGGGKITTAAVNPDLQSIPGYASNTIKNEGTLVLESGTIENTTNAGAAYAVDCYQGSTFTMNGGKLEATRCALRMFCNSATLYTTVTINGGEIVGGTRAIWVHLPGSDSTKAAAANLTITGGTFDGGSGQSLYVYTFGNNHTATFVTITGGTFLNDVMFGGGTYMETRETVSITGGTFNGYLGRWLVNDGWEDMTADEGYHMIEGVVGAHDYEAVVTDPTCTAAGYTTYTCACGDTYEEAGEAATGEHNYENGICSVCEAKDPNYVDYYLIGWINGADYGNGGDYANLGEYKFVNGQLTVTFTADSYIGVKSANLEGEIQKWFWSPSYVQTNEGTFEHGKDYGEKMLVPGGVEVTFTLTVIDENTITVAIAYHVHNYVGEVTTEPTCTEKGVKTFTCTCGEGTYTEEIDATGHTAGAAATCTTAQTCTVCGVELAPATGHTAGAAATCTTAQTCTVCGAELAPATGHVNTTTTTVDATCATAGSTTVTCACGEVISTTEIPATGEHNYVDGECSNCKSADPNYAPEQPDQPTEPEQPAEEEEANFFAKIWAKILAVLQTVLGFFKGIFVKG